MSSTGPVITAVHQVLPVLKDHAAKTEQDRMIAPEVVDALTATGVFGMPIPVRFGGLQSPLDEQVHALTEIASGCGSAAWCTAIYFTGAWAVSLFPDEAASEVFDDPTTRTSIVSSPTGTLTDDGDHYTLAGTWRFNSGIRHADWDVLGAQLGERHVLVLVPRHDLTVHDDWHTSGLQGTGSNSVTATALRVPRHRVLPYPDTSWARLATHPSNDEDFYHYELYPLLSALNAGPAIGLALAAENFFSQHVNGRGITFTRYGSQRDASITHRQLSEVRMKIIAAIALSDRLATGVHEHAMRRKAHSITERAEARALAAYSTMLAREAVDLVQSASGASSIRRDVPVQRLTRDALAMSLHAALNVDSALELHGRVLLDLPAETAFL
ncbi:alkylation response protein AidB-like acyl-CoA dehydrogenase [Kibdelosporangium banguiense]|uniref:Alkylation response protein AidB-like acyl-CoA dehydrogenase n=1 Tax=Kibdelosporangium banguiense TaxID=1365924 RepID=A0ABS4U1V5_9PSEU|nr:acyl-CoA dehydrogenase family protein [Kibdelosporangium banguiense]MBP2330647.1 alkylation response protein AidB-like acyl-CoA dehydrogenase [Kibdelosporangium banguiense]